MGKAEVPHRLYWNKQLVGVITEATFSDFPWVIGRFEARRVGKRLREVLDWFVAQSEEDQSQDPPFEAEFLEGWVIVKPDGERHELFLPPLIDFDKGFAEWR